MNGSLYSLLTSQHQDRVLPMKCNEHLLMRLVRHFEDLVVENQLNALVVQGRCLDGNRETEPLRFARVAAISRHHYIFACGPNCDRRTWSVPTFPKTTVFEQRDFHQFDTGPFFLIVDSHVSVLLASARIDGGSDDEPAMYNTVWSFEPDVVFTGLEYLRARVAVQHPAEEPEFAARLDESAPHSPSLRLTLNLTTRLALLLQRQNEIEATINRISSMLNSVFQLDDLYQRIVDLVRKTLLVRRATLTVLRQDGQGADAVHESVRPRGEDVRHTGALVGISVLIETPIAARGVPIGLLAIEDDDPGRIWEYEEEMMLRTVADQLAVGISNARLVKVIEEQAMTDEVTGLYNRKYFFDRLLREVQFAGRMNTEVSLVVIDFEGRPTVDETLRRAVTSIKMMLRSVDVVCRFSGTSFALILPATGRHGAILVAERLRSSLSVVGLQADVGLCTYPTPALNSDELLSMALHETRMSRA